MNSIKDIVECDEEGFEFYDEEEDAEEIEFHMKVKERAMRGRSVNQNERDGK